jgi:signal peptidase II
VAARRNYRPLFVMLALFGLVADQASKYGMFRWLYGKENHESEVVPGWFRFTAQFDPETPIDQGIWKTLQTWSAPVMPHVNKGALFGLGGDHKNLANGIFATISLIAAIAICIWASRRSVAQDGWLSSALGLILGGAIGNCYDRIVFSGVRDFMYFYRIEWPVFNGADCCLVVGTGILLVQALFAKQPVPEAAPHLVSNQTPASATV